MDLILIGGMSGSGKNVALAALEDSGYYAVNNLPLPLLVQTGKRGYDSLTLPGKYDKRSLVTKERFAKIFRRNIVCGEVRARQKLFPAIFAQLIRIAMKYGPGSFW